MTDPAALLLFVALVVTLTAIGYTVTLKSPEDKR